MRCQKPVSYMGRNVTRWGIQLLDIFSGLIQKGSQARHTASSAGWSQRQSRVPPAAGTSRARRKFLPSRWKGSSILTAISQLETDHGFHLAVVKVEFSLYLHQQDKDDLCEKSTDCKAIQMKDS